MTFKVKHKPGECWGNIGKTLIIEDIFQWQCDVVQKYFLRKHWSLKLRVHASSKQPQIPKVRWLSPGPRVCSSTLWLEAVTWESFQQVASKVQPVRLKSDTDRDSLGAAAESWTGNQEMHKPLWVEEELGSLEDRAPWETSSAAGEAGE